MKQIDLSSTIAAEMDKVLNSDENKQLFSSSSMIEKLAFKKVSEEDAVTEVETELALQKTASVKEPVKPTVKSTLDQLLAVSEQLDSIGFDKLAAASIMLADRLVSEAKAKSSKKSDKKSDKKSKEDKSKSKGKKVDMKDRMKKMREMQKGKKDKKSSDGKKSSEKK